MLVFDGIWSDPMKLNNISFANQTQPFRPKRKRALDPDAFLKCTNRLIDPLMHRPASQRVKVLIKRLLDMNQSTLPRAVTVMLQGGDHNEIGVVPVIANQSGHDLANDSLKQHVLRQF